MTAKKLTFEQAQNLLDAGTHRPRLITLDEFLEDNYDTDVLTKDADLTNELNKFQDKSKHYTLKSSILWLEQSEFYFNDNNNINTYNFENDLEDTLMLIPFSRREDKVGDYKEDYVIIHKHMGGDVRNTNYNLIGVYKVRGLMSLLSSMERNSQMFESCYGDDDWDWNDFIEEV